MSVSCSLFVLLAVAALAFLRSRARRRRRRRTRARDSLPVVSLKPLEAREEEVPRDDKMWLTVTVRDFGPRSDNLEVLGVGGRGHDARILTVSERGYSRRSSMPEATAQALSSGLQGASQHLNMSLHSLNTLSPPQHLPTIRNNIHSYRRVSTSNLQQGSPRNMHVEGPALPTPPGAPRIVVSKPRSRESLQEDLRTIDSRFQFLDESAASEERSPAAFSTFGK